MPAPNLLFLYTDEQRCDTLAVTGNRLIEMPNLNRLAERSCAFTRTYVTQPVCTPSRSTILTGLYPHANGCTENNVPLGDEIACLPEMLPEGRYVTAHMGKWHLGDELYAQHGFDEWVSIEDAYNGYFRPGRDRDVVSDYTRWLISQDVTPADGRAFSRGEAARLPEALGKPAFLAREASRFIRENRTRPFCLYVNFLEPHMPFFSPRDDQYDPRSIPLPDNFDAPPGEDTHLKHRLFRRHYAEHGHSGIVTDSEDAWRRLVANYWGLCGLVDTHCGAILRTLDECGLMDDTIVVFTSDHGDMMASHQLIAKCVMYEEAVRVPLLIKPPRSAAARVADGPVSQIDLVPTLLEMMGVEAAGHLQGRSLAGLMDRPSAEPDDDVVVQWNGPNCGISGDVLGSVNLPPHLEAVADADTAARAITDPVRTIITRDGRWKLSVSPMGFHELYDLSADPLERRNVFASAPDPLKRDLLARLRRWQDRTGDDVELPDFS